MNHTHVYPSPFDTVQMSTSTTPRPSSTSPNSQTPTLHQTLAICSYILLKLTLCTFIAYFTNAIGSNTVLDDVLLAIVHFSNGTNDNNGTFIARNTTMKTFPQLERFRKIQQPGLIRSWLDAMWWLQDLELVDTVRTRLQETLIERIPETDRELNADSVVWRYFRRSDIVCKCGVLFKKDYMYVVIIFFMCQITILHLPIIVHSFRYWSYLLDRSGRCWSLDGYTRCM